MGRTIYGPIWENMPTSRRSMLERGLRRIAREFGGAMRHAVAEQTAQRKVERGLKSLAV